MDSSVLPFILAVVALGVFVQAAIGFGSALLAMPLLASLIGLRRAVPFFAMVTLTAEFIMVLRYRKSIRPRNIRPLLVGSLTGIPFGIAMIGRLPEAFMLSVLGVLILAYVAYVVIKPGRLRLHGAGWGYAFGVIGGFLSGAFNTAGPPYVVYGTANGWPPDEFKANLQSVFIFGSLSSLVGHTLAGNMSWDLAAVYGLALPGFALGMLAGFWLGRVIRPDHFRVVVLVILTVLGLNLVF